MICVKCGKEINQPLELYDGSWVCPECLKDLIGSDQSFAVTEENESIFRQSEVHYFKWLENAGGQTRLALVEYAVELCKQAAYLGNPKALLKLGYYYDKDYDEVNRSETMRCRFAYKCYRAVALATTPPTVDKKLSAIDFTELQRRAAVLLFEMMRNAPEDMKRSVATDFERTKKILSSKFGIEYRVREDNDSGSLTGRIARLNELVLSLKNNHRAPAFGVLRLSAEELTGLFAGDTASKTAVTLLTVIKKKKTDVYIVRLNQKGTVDEIDDGFYKLTNEGQIHQLLSGYNKEQPLALVFTNELGKHAFISDAEKITKALQAGDWHLIKRLLSDADRTQTEYVFYDDDLYYYAGGKKNKLATSVGNLIETVCEGGKN